MDKNKIIICRCEDVTLAELEAMMDRGFTNFEDLKRQLRVGMGPCQGQNCAELIQQQLAIYLNKDKAEIPVHKSRPLVLGVPLKAIAEGDHHES